MGEIKSNREQNKKGIGGVAIVIKEECCKEIAKITRRPHRNVQITLNTGNSDRELQILNSYAPHMGYIREQREAYWKAIKNTLQTIIKKDILIWATDNNGQIAKPREGN